MSTRAAKFLCGVPGDKCHGTNTMMPSGRVTATHKAHATRKDARACYVNFKVSQGYQRTDSRHLLESPTGEVLVITREGKFGTRVRWVEEKSRYMPKTHGGAILSS